MGDPAVCPQNLPPSSATGMTYGLGLYSFGWVFTVLCYVTYILAQRSGRFVRLRNRHPLLTHVMFAGAILHLQLDPLALMIGRENYYCGAVVLQFLIIPLLGGPVVARLLSFYFKSRFASQAMHNFRQSLKTREDMTRNPRHQRPSAASTIHAEDENDRRLSATGIARAFTYGFRDAFLFCFNTSASAATAFSSSTALLNEMNHQKDQLSLRTLRFLQSGHGISFAIFAVFLMPAFFAAVGVASTDATFAGCKGCGVPLAVSTFVLVQGGLISLMTILLLIRIRKEKMSDRWGVVAETILSVLFAGLGMLGYALLTHIDTGRNWDFTFLLSFGIWGMVFVQTALQLFFALTRDRIRVSRRRRAMQQSISAGTLHAAHYNLNVVLSDKVLAKAFEDHLQKEFGVESLFFYQEVKNWRTAYRDMGASTRLARAKKIIHTFIRNDGIFSVNIPSATSKAILLAMEDAATFPKETLFDDAAEEVRELLEMGALARFKKSETFKRLITENLQHLAPSEF